MDENVRFLDYEMVELVYRGNRHKGQGIGKVSYNYNYYEFQKESNINKIDFIVEIGREKRSDFYLKLVLEVSFKILDKNKIKSIEVNLLERLINYLQPISNGIITETLAKNEKKPPIFLGN